MIETFNIIEKALTPPTSKEVCEALSKEYGHLMSYRENIKSFGFYYDGEWYELVSLNLSGKLDFDYMHNYKPHLVTLISRFYEGIEVNER